MRPLKSAVLDPRRMVEQADGMYYRCELEYDMSRAEVKDDTVLLEPVKKCRHCKKRRSRTVRVDHQRWTQVEDKIVADPDWRKHGDAAIAKRLGRTKQSVASRRHALRHRNAKQRKATGGGQIVLRLPEGVDSAKD